MNRKDASGFDAADNWGCGYCPCFAAIWRTQHAPFACADPDIAFALRENTSPARRKSAFVFQRWGDFIWCQNLPVCAAIIGVEQQKFPVNRIAHRNAVLLIPKRKGIKKRFRVFVFELQFPMLPTIRSFINPRRFPVTNTQQIRGVCAKRFDITEIQLLSIRDISNLPGLTTVKCATKSSFCAAHPNDLRIDRTKPAKTGVGIDCLLLPLRKGKQQEESYFHFKYPGKKASTRTVETTRLATARGTVPGALEAGNPFVQLYAECVQHHRD